MPGGQSNSDLVAFTIVAHNYIPQSQIVAESFAAHHPGCAFYIVVTDHPLQTKLLRRHDKRLVPITDIDFGSEGFEHMATFYDVMEFATAVKPFVLRHLLRAAGCVLYLDPDIEVFAPLDPIVEATRRVGISLTPHCLEPIARDGYQPSETGILMAGIYNLGYIGVASGSEPFLDWWSSRLRRDAISDPANHIFTDQRWIDLSVPLFHPHIEKSPAYNVAYWNLDQRPIRRVDGKYFVNDEPLRFFHFSGYDPTNPYWISKHQTNSPRVLLSNEPVLEELFSGYGTKLLAHRSEKAPLTYGWGQPIPGMTLSHSMRRRFRDEMVLADAGLGEMPPTPFRPGGPAKFIKWMSEPSLDGPSTVPRYLLEIWESRHDLRAHMPEVVGGDLANLRRWVQQSGCREYDMLGMIGWLPDIHSDPGIQWHQAGATEQGVNLVGYLNAELGVGESARLTAASLRASGVGVATVATRRTPSRQQVKYPADNIARYDTIVMGVNADQVALVQGDLGKSFMAGRYVIGQWYWELESFPVELHDSFGYVDEVWAATKFIRDSVAAAAPARVTVTHMPIALSTPTFDPNVTRRDLGLPEGFMFLFTWDMLSVIARKNPYGLIAAYRDAFSPSDGALLVLKTMNGRFDVRVLEQLRWACRDRPDIMIIDEVFDPRRAGSLTNLCDCYVSLHRSEGFGLTMAEAMLLEKPVIATDYSGNVDFTTADVSYPVRWQPTNVPPGAGPYRAGSVWADPDLTHAAELMRRVFADRVEAQRIGAAARLRLLDTNSLERCGAAMRQRLEEIWSN